jgi:hypothetical protein
MQSGGLTKHLLLAFLIALMVYAGFFSLDQHLRRTRGPWRVTFATEPSGDASIAISQPRVGVTNLKIILAGEKATNVPVPVLFDFPQRPVPFGKVKFEDLTYLPGTVTLDLFGHEIELLPRTLIINRREIPWQSGTTVVLAATDKIPGLAAPRRSR